MTHPTTPDQGDERIRDCFNCIDGTKPPAACRRCTACIDDDARPNWFPKDGAEREYRSWLPILSAAQPVAPDGYALISVDALRAWGKLDEVTAACKYPIAAPQPSQGAFTKEELEVLASAVGALNFTKYRCLFDKVEALRLAPPHPPVSAEAGKGVDSGYICARCKAPLRAGWTCDACGSDEADDAPSESRSVSGEVSDEQVRELASEWGLDNVAVRFAMAVLALAGSAKEAAALERMARLDDEMGIEP